MEGSSTDRDSNEEVNSSVQTEKVKPTAAQLARMDKNRHRALLIKQARQKTQPYPTELSTAAEKSIIRVQGSKFIDTGGGFLLEEKDLADPKEPVVVTSEPAPIIEPDRPSCIECSEDFYDSFLFQNFEYAVCDKCRDNEDKHSLITKTEAKNFYLLKDCDFDKREPALKFIVRKNPHNSNWGDMKLYLQLQVEKRALEVWETEEKLEEERERRQEAKEKAKIKKYNKQIKALRMNVRSSLYNKTSSNHQHSFGPEEYNEEDDVYTRKCTTCNFEETFEKM
ncbi:DNA repair protein complementing XP-A cells homolog [Ischnura elegans]|uniref:DNA repair protein complementing XP-A cells homolog n=1 Tax=Ischnura elegans TaxID=197161 RepID=UPI001ED8BDB5|nr:DNA repair protein complementing XP-A cells homolog [Ischnura elegans]